MLLLCKVAALTLVALPTLCGPVDAARILGGHEARKHSRPYMVLMELHSNGCIQHCGGILVSVDFVLTAAHCQAQSYKVFLGLHSFYHLEGVQQLSVEKQFPHKNYSECLHMNDIMLLKLSSSAKLTENVKPIGLADSSFTFLPKFCNVSGWGQTKINGQMSPILLEANVELIKNEKCDEKRMYCSSGEKGPGKGDSGGPLVCEDGKAHGVVSVNYKPNKNAKTVYMYTKIVNYRDWIDTILKKNATVDR